jgi:hypothetical protein
MHTSERGRCLQKYNNKTFEFIKTLLSFEMERKQKIFVFASLFIELFQKKYRSRKLKLRTTNFF